MRTVVWTDAVQVVILLVGLVVIAVVGAEKQGGARAVWDTAQRSGRLNFIKLEPTFSVFYFTQAL